MSKIKFEIKNRWTGSILFEYEKENNTLIETVEKAVEEGANLGDADLGGANLEGANLRDADLGGANLEGANLRDADLGDADLGDANLEGANLGGANLEGASLEDANLEGAYLREANLGGANLREANLRDANLGDADLGGANLEGANLEGASLKGANLEGAYIDFNDIEIDSEEIIKDFEERNSIKIIETYTNKNVIPTRWDYFWKYGLTIDKWKIKEKEKTIKENKEIEELNDTNYVESEMSCEDANYYHNLTRNKLNEVIRAVNKLTKESKAK